MEDVLLGDRDAACFTVAAGDDLDDVGAARGSHGIEIQGHGVAPCRLNPGNGTSDEGAVGGVEGNFGVVGAVQLVGYDQTPAIAVKGKVAGRVFVKAVVQERLHSR